MRRSHHLILSAVSNTLGYTAAAIAGLVLPPFVVGEIGADRYGLVVVLTSVLQILALVHLGTPQALQRFVSQGLALGEHDRVSELLSTGFALLAGAGLIAGGVVACVAIAPDRFLAYPEDLPIDAARLVVVAMGVAAVLSLPLSIGTVAFYATGRFVLLNGIQLGATLLRVALVFLLLWRFESSVVAYASANGVATLFGSLLIFAWGMRLLPRAALSMRRVTWDTIRRITGYGVLVFLNVFAIRFFVEADYVIVGWILGPEHVTVLNLALVWGLMLRGIASASLSVLTPSAAIEAARDSVESLQDMLVRSTKYSLVMGLAPILFLCGFRHEVMQTWMGDGFTATAEIMIPILLAELCTIGAAGVNGMIYGLGTIRPVLLINLLTGITNVALVLMLTGYYDMGVTSVAWTYFGVFFVRSGIALPVWFARRIGLEAGFLYARSYARPLLAGALALPLIPLLRPLAEQATWPAILSAAGLFSIGCAPLFLFVAFDRYDRQVLLSMGARLLSRRRGPPP